MIRKVCFFGPKKKRFMQTESVLQTKNRSGPAKNPFSVALGEKTDWVGKKLTSHVFSPGERMGRPGFSRGKN